MEKTPVNTDIMTILPLCKTNSYKIYITSNESDIEYKNIIIESINCLFSQICYFKHQINIILRTASNEKDLFNLINTEGNPNILFFDAVTQCNEIISKIQINPIQYNFPIVILVDNFNDHRLNNIGINTYDVIQKPLKHHELVFRLKKLLFFYYYKKIFNEILNLVNGKTDDIFYETIVFLSRIIESNDDTTGKHIDRVSEYSIAIASAMGIKGHDLNTLNFAAKLHDIGKMAIPESIIMKPGKLTQEEFEIIKSHTIKGAVYLQYLQEYNLLKKDDFLNAASEVTLYHHERWDGQGYPYNLKGKEIPLFARIVGLVDVFDALIHKRAYKPAWTIDEAIGYIKEQRGKHFDPDVVDAFMKAFL